MNVTELQLFHAPAARLRLTVPGERSYVSVKPVWSAPLSRPNRYLALLDGKGDEIILIDDPRTLPESSLQAVEVELHRRYLSATIQVVHSARQEHGATYWDVDTNRGKRDFITQSLQENAIWLSDDHLLMLDVDGSRFEIPSIAALDQRSRAIVTGIV